MSKLLFISLGSGFDPTLETGFGFIQQYILNGDSVHVVSIDSELLHDVAELHDEGISIQRISKTLTRDKREIENFIQHNIKMIDSFDDIIVCDGLHFFNVQIGEGFLEELRKASPSSSVIKFTYISPFYESPMFINSSFDRTPILNHAFFSKFIDKELENLSPLIKNGNKVLQALSRQFKKETYLHGQACAYIAIKNFIKHAPFCDKKAQRAFVSSLNESIMSLITIELLENKKGNQLKM